MTDAGQAADVADRLRPFIARRIPAQDVDDVLQETFVRMQRGIANLRDDARMTPWLYQVARSAVADHLRARQR
ncbi:MAG TPA: sigma factor, partial [Kofleriaceae bacterium]